MGVSLEKVNVPVRAVRIHTWSRTYAWIDVAQLTNGTVRVGYRSKRSGITEHMISLDLDWERVVKRESDAERRADHLRDVRTLR